MQCGAADGLAERSEQSGTSRGPGQRPFGRMHRMRTRGEFSQVFQLGRSAADAHFVVYTRDNGRRWSRLGCGPDSMGFG